MSRKLLILYCWLVRTLLFFWPDIPAVMRFRGWLYGLGMKSCGKNFQVTYNVIMNSVADMIVGDNVYIAYNCCFITNGTIVIGDNVLFGPNVVVSSGNHIYKDGIFLKRSEKKDVTIGNGCWIAANTTITGGSILPASSVLAAGAVLTPPKNNSQPSGLYAGIPAKFIKAF